MTIVPYLVAVESIGQDNCFAYDFGSGTPEICLVVNPNGVFTPAGSTVPLVSLTTGYLGTLPYGTQVNPVQAVVAAGPKP